MKKKFQFWYSEFFEEFFIFLKVAELFPRQSIACSETSDRLKEYVVYGRIFYPGSTIVLGAPHYWVDLVLFVTVVVAQYHSTLQGSEIQLSWFETVWLACLKKVLPLLVYHSNMLIINCNHLWQTSTQPYFILKVLEGCDWGSIALK